MLLGKNKIGQISTQTALILGLIAGAIAIFGFPGALQNKKSVQIDSTPISVGRHDVLVRSGMVPFCEAVFNSATKGKLIAVEGAVDEATKTPVSGSFMVWENRDSKVFCREFGPVGQARSLLFSKAGLKGTLRAIGGRGDYVFRLLAENYARQHSTVAEASK